MKSNTTLIRNATIVNEGKTFLSDLLIKNNRIEKISSNISIDFATEELDAEGLILIPGIIDDQVHFREPGLTHKADIYTESRAAVAGGITSYMEMPNTNPQTLTQSLLKDKYELAAKKSIANYSFYMGAGNHNIEEVLKTDPKNVCGVKIFMGSSTGDMLVDDEATLNKIFSSTPMLIATHCEDEQSIVSNLKKYKLLHGNDIGIEMHPEIRSREACYLSSSRAVSLAKKYNSRLHILHISTKEELDLFRNDIPLEQKRITAEACVHHLWFSDEDYPKKKNFIKWNPAVKTAEDREAIRKAIVANKIDVIATDHAPHTLQEKEMSYLDAPSGGPLVQHSLLAMLDLVKHGVFTLELVVKKMSHDPAVLFTIQERGYIREGYYADLVLIDQKKSYTVSRENILYKCAWSPFEEHTFQNSIHTTFVNGNKVYSNGQIHDCALGSRLMFTER
ncbi:MAG TPA: dihydroorotase [Bacteroidia bacterium]|nr:dihydroorotase [Bacteroidia bacterium]HNT79425.1 dihydroorotase [Bacteroidia bacterium]